MDYNKLSAELKAILAPGQKEVIEAAKNWEFKGKFICPIHGEYEQDMYTKFKKVDCPKCSRSEARKLVGFKKRLKRLEPAFKTMVPEDIEKVKRGELGAHDKARFICSIHGEYSQRITNQIDYGCPKCGDQRGADKRSEKVRSCYSFTNEQLAIINTSPRKDDILSGKVTKSDKVTCVCPVHGPWENELRRVLEGCPKCRHQKKKEDNFLNRFRPSVQFLKDLKGSPDIGDLYNPLTECSTLIPLSKKYFSISFS